MWTQGSVEKLFHNDQQHKEEPRNVYIYADLATEKSKRWIILFLWYWADPSPGYLLNSVIGSVFDFTWRKTSYQYPLHQPHPTLKINWNKQ